MNTTHAFAYECERGHRSAMLTRLKPGTGCGAMVQRVAKDDDRENKLSGIITVACRAPVQQVGEDDVPLCPVCYGVTGAEAKWFNGAVVCDCRHCSICNGTGKMSIASPDRDEGTSAACGRCQGNGFIMGPIGSARV